MSEISRDDREILLEAFKHGVVALDLETTGLSPLVDRIIELSAIKLTHEGVEKFDELVNPEIKIPEYTIEIHGIKDDMVANSRKIRDVLPEFLNFAAGLPIIAHNAKFDIGFIAFQCHKLGFNSRGNNVFCSCKFARTNLKGMPNYKLGTLSKELDIPLENHHRAYDDAVASLLIFAKALAKNKEEKGKFELFNGRLFNTDDFDRKKDLSIPKHLEILVGKCEKQHVVEMKYKGGSMKGKYRPVKPIALLPMPGGNILYAHCLVSDLYKSFSLSKIQDVKEISVKKGNEILEKLKESKSDCKE